jgi:hypothetical protein
MSWGGLLHRDRFFLFYGGSIFRGPRHIRLIWEGPRLGRDEMGNDTPAVKQLDCLSGFQSRL